jgi:hypothetical protein
MNKKFPPLRQTIIVNQRFAKAQPPANAASASRHSDPVLIGLLAGCGWKTGIMQFQAYP